MLPLDDARAYVLSLGRPLEAVPVALGDALGQVVADDVHSAEVVPPFANSAMDGFAVRAADTGDGAELTIVATVAAGSVADRTVGPGQAVRIMTGAPVPDGADAVVMVEQTTVSGDQVRLSASVAAGANVRPAGDDIGIGDLVVARGGTVTPGVIGVLATIGCASVSVVRRPRVGVLSTGDELVPGDAPLGPGQIRDSNRAALLAMVEEMGVPGVDLGLVPDDESVVESALRDAVGRCDVVLTSGGVSMGDYDVVKAVLARIAQMRWMQVAIKPAKPLAAGTIDAVPVVGLPGNPVSSMVSFELFARPLIRRLGGHDRLDRPRLTAIAGTELRRRADGKVHFVRVVLAERDGGWVATSAGGQGSHHTRSMAAADGLAVLPDGEEVAAGEPVSVIPIWV